MVFLLLVSESHFPLFLFINSREWIVCFLFWGLRLFFSLLLFYTTSRVIFTNYPGLHDLWVVETLTALAWLLLCCCFDQSNWYMRWLKNLYYLLPFGLTQLHIQAINIQHLTSFLSWVICSVSVKTPFCLVIFLVLRPLWLLVNIGWLDNSD